MGSSYELTAIFWSQTVVAPQCQQCYQYFDIFKDRENGKDEIFKGMIL